MAFCQVILKKSLIETAWGDPRCKEHFRKYPKDPLRIPFDDPDPQVSLLPEVFSPYGVLMYPRVTTLLSKEHPWHTQIHRDAFGYGAVPSEVDQRLVVDLRFFSYVKPVWENHVGFSAENTDSFGMPQVRSPVP